MSPSRTLTGPASMKSAFAAAQEKDSRMEAIPWWVAPGDRAKRVHQVGSIVAPDPASNAVAICQFQVPSGLQFAWTHLIVDFGGENWVQGAGDAIFSIDINNPANAPTPQGYPLQGFTIGTLLFGSFQPYGPYPLGMPELLDADDIARIKVTNVGITPSAPNFFNAAIIGWTRPAPRR